MLEGRPHELSAAERHCAETDSERLVLSALLVGISDHANLGGKFRQSSTSEFVGVNPQNSTTASLVVESNGEWYAQAWAGTSGNIIATFSCMTYNSNH